MFLTPAELLKIVSDKEEKQKNYFYKTITDDIIQNMKNGEYSCTIPYALKYKEAVSLAIDQIRSELKNYGWKTYKGSLIFAYAHRFVPTSLTLLESYVVRFELKWEPDIRGPSVSPIKN